VLSFGIFLNVRFEFNDLKTNNVDIQLPLSCVQIHCSLEEPEMGLPVQFPAMAIIIFWLQVVQITSNIPNQTLVCGYLVVFPLKCVLH
jgi:hypothetical protein